MRLYLTMVLVFAWVSAATAEVIYVDIDATGGNTGIAWADAYLDLQDALAVAVAGDDIWVAEGTYSPSTEVDWEATFSLVNGTRVFGGFAGHESVREERDWDVNETVLSGDLGVEPAYQTVSEFIVTATQTDSTATLDGFTLTGGRHGLLVDEGNPMFRNLLVTRNIGYGGGGHGVLLMNGCRPTFLLCEISFNQGVFTLGGGVSSGPACFPRFEHVLFEGNSYAVIGGAVWGDGNFYYVEFRGNRADDLGGGLSGGGVLENVSFVGNRISGYYGAGMRGRGTLTNVQFVDNRGGAARSGGGLHGGGTLVNVLFDRNRATYGAGMHDPVGGSTLTNVLFVNNEAEVGGGGLWIGGLPFYSNSMDALPVQLINVGFVGNAVLGNVERFISYSSAAIFSRGGLIHLQNCIVWNQARLPGGPLPIHALGAEIQIESSLIEDCGGSGASWDVGFGTDLGGNIDADPLFVDLAGGDLHLTLASPAINAGSSALIPSGVTTDLDGLPRIYGSAVDMGAYEFQGPSSRDIFSAMLTPQSLNLGSNGNSIQVKLTGLWTIPTSDIDGASVVLNDSIAPLPRSVKSNGQHLKAKFDRAEVMATLEPGDAVPVTVSGLLLDGTPFSAVDSIRVIDPNAPTPPTLVKAPAVAADLQVVPPKRYLRAAPNPFNPSTTIYFGLERSGYVTLTIYDLAGRRVRQLVSAQLESGPHDIQWSGLDDAGRQVASGVYLYQMRADESVETKRMVLVK